MNEAYLQVLASQDEELIALMETALGEAEVTIALQLEGDADFGESVHLIGFDH